MHIRTDMPDLYHWRVITDEEIERLRAGALRILDQTGFRICSRPILERLDQRGLRVDYGSMTVRATPAQMEIVERNARAHTLTGLEEATRQRAIKARDSSLLRRALPG